MEQLLLNTLCGSVVSSIHIVCDCGHFEYVCWATQLHVGVARVQDTDKLVDQSLGCHSMCVSVNDATRTVTTFSVPRLGMFLSGLQDSDPGISHISYLLRVRNTNSKYG